VSGPRLAVNAAIYDQRPSGLGGYAENLVRALHGLHDNLIVYTSRPGDLPAARPIRPWGEPSRGLPGHLWRLVWTQTALPLRSRLDRAQVLVNTLPEGPVARVVPQVTVVHDILPLFFPADFPRQQWYFRAFVPAVLRASRAIIADSQQTADDVARHYRIPPERITVVPPGVDFTRFRPHLDGDAVASRFGLQRYLLFVGNVRPHKNLQVLVEAVARLDAEVSLAVAGYRDPRYWPLIAARIERLGLRDRVRVLDYVPNGILPALYSAALAVVVPSLYEGFGLPVLEAMACGAPVIASTTGGLREAVGEAAIRVDPGDVDALAAELRRVIGDAGLRADLTRRGLDHARAFTWDRTARGVLSVVNQTGLSLQRRGA